VAYTLGSGSHDGRSTEPTRGVGAQILLLRQALSRFLAVVTAERARSRNELASAPEVQNEIPRRELAGVRARARPARRRDILASPDL